MLQPDAVWKSNAARENVCVPSGRVRRARGMHLLWQSHESSETQAFLVESVRQDRRDVVKAFFEAHADDLFVQSPDAPIWQQWCTLSYIQKPWEKAAFKVRAHGMWSLMFNFQVTRMRVCVSR